MNTFCAHAGNPFDHDTCTLWSRAVLPVLTFAQRGAPAVPFVGGQTLVDIPLHKADRCRYRGGVAALAPLRRRLDELRYETPLEAFLRSSRDGLHNFDINKGQGYE